MMTAAVAHLWATSRKALTDADLVNVLQTALDQIRQTRKAA